MRSSVQSRCPPPSNMEDPQTAADVRPPSNIWRSDKWPEGHKQRFRCRTRKVRNGVECEAEARSCRFPFSASVVGTRPGLVDLLSGEAPDANWKHESLARTIATLRRVLPPNSILTRRLIRRGSRRSLA